MLLTSGIDHKKLRRVNGGFEYAGIGRFTTTGATVELPVPFGTIDSVVLTPIGAYNANDRLSVDETVAADGTIARPAGKSITITRNTGGTSGLAFGVVICGR